MYFIKRSKLGFLLVIILYINHSFGSQHKMSTTSDSKRQKLYNRSYQQWTDDHSLLIRNLFDTQVLDPEKIHKSQISWITEDPKYPQLHPFHPNDERKWRILQRKVKKIATLYLTEAQASGKRVSPASKYFFDDNNGICFAYRFNMHRTFFT